MSTINERIKRVVELTTSGNASKFARMCDVSSSIVNSIIGGRKSEPSFSVLSKIYTSVHKYGVSAHWLLTGEGEMLEENLNACKQVELATKINEIRESLDLNVSEFAKRVNISQGNMSAMLNNKRVIGDGVVNKICVELGIEKEYFSDEHKTISNKVLGDDFALLLISSSKLKSIAKGFLEEALK